MRAVVGLACVALAMCGCTDALLPLAAADAASVVVFGRGIVDIGVSAATGRDCSVVRLDRRQSYCAPPEPAYGPAPYCTRTLADVVCWSDPDRFVLPPRPVADGPALTPEQMRDAARRWPKALNLDYD